jgi:hypothetical protein
VLCLIVKLGVDWMVVVVVMVMKVTILLTPLAMRDRIMRPVSCSGNICFDRNIL